MTTTAQLRDAYDRLTDLGDDFTAEAVADLTVQVEAGVVSEQEALAVLAGLLAS